MSEGLASFSSEGTYSYDELVAGETISVSGVVAAGQGVLLRGQIVGQNGTSGKWTRTDTPGGILAHDVDTTADVQTVIYTQGKFKDNAVIVTGTGLTIAQARAALKDTGVYLLDVQE